MKFCKDCGHYIDGAFGTGPRGHWCSSLDGEHLRDKITGRLDCYKAREPEGVLYMYCGVACRACSTCGPDAKWFKPKED